MTIKYYNDLVQGSDEWFAARCGLLTASEMKFIITPTQLKYASNDKERTHLYELAAQRVNNYVEPHYIGDEMLRGHDDEIRAKLKYNEAYAIVEECGFITNNKWGFTLGYSPDGLVGSDGQIEAKSRRQKYQLETIVTGLVPEEFKIQVQTGLLVSEREWCDFITYSGGMPMYTLRVYKEEETQEAIVKAAKTFHEKLENIIKKYHGKIADKESRFIPTERIIEQEMFI